MTARIAGLTAGSLALALALGARAAPASLTLKGELEGASDGVRALAFTADGKWLLAGDDSAVLTVFDVEARKKTASMQTRHKTISALAAPAQSGLVASAGKDGVIRIWDPAAGKLVREIKASDDALFALAFDASGTALASGGDDKVLRVHDPDTGLLQTEIKGHEDAIRGVAFVDGGRSLLSCASDKTLRLWDLQSRRETRNQVERAAEYGDLNGLAVSPAGGAFVTLARELRRANAGIRGLSGRGGSNVAEDNVLILRDLASWAEQARLEGHLRAIHAAAFSPDGSLIASVADDQALLVWDREAKAKLVAFDEPDKQYAVAFSPDGRWLAAAGDDKKVHLYAVKLPPKPAAAAAQAAPQPAAPAPVLTVAEAKTAYDQGRREFNLGHYPDALALFEQAYKIKPAPRLLYNIAQCHRLLGNLEQAKRVYRAFIAESPPDEPMIASVEEKLQEIDRALRVQTDVRESAPSGLAQDKDKDKPPAIPATPK